MNIKVITNRVPRYTLDASELSNAERAEFDYLNWNAIDNGEDGATFFRYKGELYYLWDFTADYGITKGTGLPDHLCDWDGYMSQSAFSAIVVKFPNPSDSEYIIVGRVLT